MRAFRPPVLCVFWRLLNAQPTFYPSTVHLHMMGSYKAQHLRYSRVVLPRNACHFIHPLGGFRIRKRCKFMLGSVT